MRTLRRRCALALSLVLISPGLALACPVCFGQSDAPMARAANLGILFLLGVTGFVLASFGAFFIYLMRRARMAAQLQAEDPISCSNT
jgi:hypothetical protein